MEPDLRGTPVQVGIYCDDVPAEAGGVNTCVAELLEAFLELAHGSSDDFFMLCPPEVANAIRVRIRAPNVKVITVSPHSLMDRLIKRLRSYSPLFRMVLRRIPSRIESIAKRQALSMIWYISGGVYECPDLPYVAIVWDLQHRYQPFFPEVSGAGEWDAREQFYGYFLRRAAYCLTGTNVGKEEIQYLYQIAEPRVRVFPLPTPAFAQNAGVSTVDVRVRFGFDGDFVFYPAQFWPHKNHVNLILALKWLNENSELAIKLVLCGSDKGNLSFIQEFVEQQGMTDQVRFLGFVSKDELVALYQQAVALTFVTYFGPDNIPPLEAFALGCPVIASAVEGAREQYEEAVIHVDPTNPEAIGRAIWDLHSNNGLRERLINEGFVRAKRWTPTDYIKAMFRLFDEFGATRRNWL